jgi:hypothetical protein
VISVADTAVKLVAAAVPKLTPVAPVNAVPVTVTVVPPAVGPDIGEIAVTAGTGATAGEALAVAGNKPPLTVASTTLAQRNRARGSRFSCNATLANVRVTTGENITAPTSIRSTDDA